MSPFPRGQQEARHPRAFRRARWRDTDLRVSDADRAEVADLLSKHYSDGRLDEGTFNDRLDQAMRASTESDLAALLADLPPAGGPATAAPRPQARPGQGQRRRGHRILLLILVVLLAAMAGPLLARILALAGLMSIPWLLIGLIAFIWLSHRRRHGRL